jgi:RNA polymerase sigma-70 factor, ECF subfamily
VQDEDTDDRLIERTATGDRAAFERLMERHAAAVLRLARAMAPDEATAADVVQEALLAAYRGAATYRPGVASVRTWMFSIARNAARKAARRHTREQPLDDADETPLVELGANAGWGADVPTARFEEHENLVRALSVLPPEDLQIILLRDIEGLPGEEAAQVLGVGLPALKSRLHRARLRLMAVMRAGEGGVVENQRERGGLTCGEVLGVLGEYVDGELPAGTRARVDAHLRECTVCERFGGRYAGVVESARARLGAAPAVDAAHLERIRRALDG